MPVTTRSMITSNQNSNNNYNNIFSNQNNQSNTSNNIFANQQQQNNRGNIFSSGNNSQNLFNNSGNQNQNNNQNTNNIFASRNNNGQQGNNIFNSQNNQGNNNILNKNSNQGNSGNKNIFNSGQNNQGNNIFNNGNNQNSQRNNMFNNGNNNNQSNNIFSNNSSSNNNRNIFSNNNTSSSNSNIFSNNNPNTTSSTNIFSTNNNNNRNQPVINWQTNQIQNPTPQMILKVYQAQDDSTFNRMYRSNVDVKKAIVFLERQTSNPYPREYCMYLSAYFQQHIKDAEELTQRLLGNRYQPPNQYGYRGNNNSTKFTNNNSTSGGNNLFNSNSSTGNKFNNTSNNNYIFGNNNTVNKNLFPHANNNRIFPCLSPLPIQYQPQPTRLSKQQQDLIYDRIEKIQKKNEEMKKKILLIRGHIETSYPKMFVKNQHRVFQYNACEKRIKQLTTELKNKIQILKQIKHKGDPKAGIKKYTNHFIQRSKQIIAKDDLKTSQLTEQARMRYKLQAEQKLKQQNKIIVKLLKHCADNIKNLQIQLTTDRISMECLSEYENQLAQQQALRGVQRANSYF